VEGGVFVKALVHVDREDLTAMNIALSNIENLLAAAPGAEVAVVANGNAVIFFTQHAPSHVKERLTALAERGVKFYICNNSLRAHGIDRGELLPFAEVVPAGIVKILELQSSGYLYVKP
jgi:intracellular sulfur oxidation DsrE/DsrF family protein